MPTQPSPASSTNSALCRASSRYSCLSPISSSSTIFINFLSPTSSLILALPPLSLSSPLSLSPQETDPMAELRREDPPRVVSVLSSVLRRVAELNDLAIHGRLAAPHHRASAFHVPRIPGISVHSYLERIFRHADCSPTCYVVAYVYLDRFTQRQPPVFINSLNVHRLLLTSILTAVKFRERIHYDVNAYFARIGGITLMEMNNLEVNFSFGVGFELYATPTVFVSYCSRLREEMYLLDSPPAPPRFRCCSTEEESNGGSWLLKRRSST